MSALKPFRKRNRQRNPNLFQYGGTFPPPARCYVRENTDQVVCDFPVQSATQGANPMMTNPRRFTARANPTTGQSIALTTLSASQAGSTPLPRPIAGSCFDPATGEVVDIDTGTRYPVRVVEDMGTMVSVLFGTNLVPNLVAKCEPGATLPPPPPPADTSGFVPTPVQGACFDPATGEVVTDTGIRYPVEVVEDMGSMVYAFDPSESTSEHGHYGAYFAKCVRGATLPANGQTFSARPVTPPPSPTPTSKECCLATGDDGAMFLQCRTNDGTPYAYPVQVVSMSGGQALVRDPVTGMEMTVAACPDRSPRPSPVLPPTFRDRPDSPLPSDTPPVPRPPGGTRPSPVPPPTFRDRPMRPSEPPPSQPQPPMLRPTESSCGGMTQGMTAMFGSPVLPDFSGNSSSMLALTMIQPNLPQNVSGLQSPVQQAPMMGLGGGAAMMGPGGGFTQQMVLPTNVPMAPAATPRSGLSSPLQAQMSKKCSCEDCDCNKTAEQNPRGPFRWDSPTRMPPPPGRTSKGGPGGCKVYTINPWTGEYTCHDYREPGSQWRFGSPTQQNPECDGTLIIDPFTGKTTCYPKSRQPGSAFRFGSPTRSAAATECEGTLIIDPFTGKTTCYDRRPGSSFRFGSPTQQNPGGMESRRFALTNPMIASPATVTTQNQEVGYGDSIRWL